MIKIRHSKLMNGVRFRIVVFISCTEVADTSIHIISITPKPNRSWIRFIRIVFPILNIAFAVDCMLQTKNKNVVGLWKNI